MSLLFIMMLQKLKGLDSKPYKNDHAQDDPVPSKDFKVMFFNVGHKELNGQDGYDKCYSHTDQEDHQLLGGKVKAKL